MQPWGLPPGQSAPWSPNVPNITEESASRNVLPTTSWKVVSIGPPMAEGSKPHRLESSGAAVPEIEAISILTKTPMAIVRAKATLPCHEWLSGFCGTAEYQVNATRPI